ncbi:hypothetical protein CHLRE_08g369350v5 [Chlamydomonas reinhardtii]|uniref:Uncharacterized protein n=1 Tax=Chlamydomonas reinhardtii TaxID=3055 RepID=A0A2K3DH41_CHLRE|nr:uncharacterized protein CHLRE_08g369350v5 [Chlamydomonas reinhardtii]PNW79852.1 hypothetical protein CHLRE_08g369350v5 [Chlamydomonas reinhardtii]
MHVLLDAENTSPVTRSEFGRLYRRLIAVNPFFSAMFVNGGLIGTLYALITLSGHRAALKKSKAAAAAGAKKKKEETKKDK